MAHVHLNTVRHYPTQQTLTYCYTLQVIVMSGQETIRVLEVEVDTALSSSGADGKVESGGEEGGGQTLEAVEEAPLESPETARTTAGERIRPIK